MNYLFTALAVYAGRFADLHGTVAVCTVFRFEKPERIRWFDSIGS